MKLIIIWVFIRLIRKVRYFIQNFMNSVAFPIIYQNYVVISVQSQPLKNHDYEF